MRNFSRARAGTGYMLDTCVTVGYDTPWRQVHAMLERAAAATAGIGSDPAPIVAQRSLSDFYIGYKLIADVTYEAPRDRAEVLGRLHENIVDEFNRHGVQLTSPHYLQDPGVPHVVTPADWHRAPARPPAD